MSDKLSRAEEMPTGALAWGAPQETISSRRVFLRNTTSGISDPIFKEIYQTFALGRDRKFRVCSNFLREIVFLRNTRPDEIMPPQPLCPTTMTKLCSFVPEDR